MTLDYRWYKKEIEYMRDMTNGTMPLVIRCSDEKERKAYKEASKGMRNIKNLEFKIEKKEK